MQKRQKAPYLIEKWTEDHDSSEFTSNLASIKKYIQEQAHRDSSSFASSIFVLVEPGKKAVLGYYSLSSISIVFNVLPPNIQKRLPRYPETGGILLGRLGVDKAFSEKRAKELGRKPRLGELLLTDAQIRCLASTKDIGSALMVVDVELPGADELAAGARDPLKFYTQYGFSPLTKHPRRLIKTMRAISKEYGSA